MNPRRSAFVLGLALLLMQTLSASAAQSVLGSDGRLFTLREATYGDVEIVSDAAAENPVLVLDIQSSDGVRTSTVVAGTEGPDIENFSFLSHEPSQDAVYVLWERRTNLIHSQVIMASYRGGEWSDEIAISDRRFSWKSSPVLVASRDSFHQPEQVEGNGLEAASVQRTILHVLWTEDRPERRVTVYSPIVLINGSYVGNIGRIVLDDLVTDGSGGTALDGLLISPSLKLSGQGKITLGFVTGSDEGRIATFRISVLSGEMSAMADDLRSHLIDFGARYDISDPEDVQRAGDDLRSHLIDFGARFDRPLVRHVADDLRSHLIDFGARSEGSPPGTDAQALADELRSHLIDFGFRLDNRGVAATSDRPRQQVDSRISESVPNFETGAPSPVSQILQIESTAVLPVPAIPRQVEDAQLFVSPDGNSALVAWAAEGAVQYMETDSSSEQWSEVRTLRLDEQTSLSNALTILENRMN